MSGDPGICYVSGRGNDVNDGLSWDTAFKSIDHAVSTKAFEIQLGSGYFPGPSQGVRPNYRKIQGRGDNTVITGGPGVGATVSPLTVLQLAAV